MRMALWWEMRRPIRKREFEERIRLIEASAAAAIKTNQTVMNRFADEQSVKAQLAELRKRVDHLEGFVIP